MNEFAKYADTWWASDQPLWTLHALHQLRVTIPRSMGCWKGKAILDVGCGAGLFSEEMLKLGAKVTAFDASPELIEVAKKHYRDSQLEGSIEYKVADAMDHGMYAENAYDAIFAFEILEHLENPQLALEGMMSSLRPGGLLVLSSPNRTAMGFLLGIVATEYILSWLPVGTHRYHQFVSLQVLLSTLIRNRFTILDVKGTWYYPLKQRFEWSHNTDVHYTVIAQKA